MSAPEHPSTAQILGALHAGLIKEGFSGDVIDDIVRMAASELIKNRGGPSVRYADAETAES